MTTVGIFYHARLETAQSLVVEATAWLEQRGHKVQLILAADDAETLPIPAGISLLVVLGGDGTTLRAAKLVAPMAVPIFNINLGRVGFLSEAEPADWQDRLDRVLSGDCRLERRLMLMAALQRGETTLAQFTALNEVVVSRGAQARLVHFHLNVDGHHVTTYAADALITATPTGSTAYSMAAGGPILPPQLHNYLVLPVAPHLSFERALVLHRQAVVAITVEMDHEARLTADGQESIPLQNGDQVVIQPHHYESRFARVDNPSYFYRRLMQRLGYWSLEK